jgi:hypothetical protein
MIQAGGETLVSAIHELINSIWDLEEFPDHQRKKSITVSNHKRAIKTDSSNYRGVSLLLTSSTMLSNSLFSRLSPYKNENVRDHQCGS